MGVFHRFLLAHLVSVSLIGGLVRSQSSNSPFADLSANEMNEVIEYMHQQTRFPLVRYLQAKMTDAHISVVETYRPNKADALNHLDNGGPLPMKRARVVIMRGDLQPPIIEEYLVSPIPKPSDIQPLKFPTWKDPIPFNARSPNFNPEQEPLFERLTTILTPVNHILTEITGGWGFVNCSDKCLTELRGMAQSTRSGLRRYLYYLARDVAGADVHPIGVQFLFNMQGLDPANWVEEYVWIQGQEFQNFAEVQTAHSEGRLQLTVIPQPEFVNTNKMRSSLNFRGDPRPSESKRGPRAKMPDGDRMSVQGRRVKWLGWEFEFGMLATSGMQMFDVSFLNQRIAYELSFQEAGVFYSGGSPAAQHTNYFDSFTIIGQRLSQLAVDIDCPSYAKFFDFVVFVEEKPRTFKDGVCIFEHNRGVPLRRHFQGAHDAGDDRYVQGIPDNVLIFRHVMTVENYDYIIDFMFHQGGQIEGKVSLSGYPLSTYFKGPEMFKYGHVFNEPRSFGMVHQHFMHLKLDLDIYGTDNRFETLDLKIEDIPDPVNTGERLLNRYFDRSLKNTELEAAYHYNFTTPKYLIVYNENEKNVFGHSKGYRIFSEGMSTQLLPFSYRGNMSRAWTHYQLAVTQYKDSERFSSQDYAQMEMFDPVLSFQNYIDDDDNIVDKDLVAWITLGKQHIPHSEDIPIVSSVGAQLTFYLIPYNYFDDDISLASRDNIRVTLKGGDAKEDTYHYAGVPGAMDGTGEEESEHDDEDKTMLPCPVSSSSALRSKLVVLVLVTIVNSFLR